MELCVTVGVHFINTFFVKYDNELLKLLNGVLNLWMGWIH